ncbi:MAG: hypothetical protein CSA62_07175 [Planctomycetota bacterium]|nr:MAG: hypothetical protein CSA62_07175 [Planctomycetota bacterium]
MREEAPQKSKSHGFDACLLAVLFFGLYASLGQEVFYKADGQQVLQLYRDGQMAWPYHPLYLPLLTGFEKLARPLGLSPYRVALLFSAFCTALGLCFGKVALSRFGLNRQLSLVAAILAGLAPPVFFFATVVELPGPLFGAAGLAFWLSARIYSRPSVPAAALLALGTSFAAGMHSSGHLLTGLLILHLLGRDAARRRGWWPSPKALGLCAFAFWLHLGLLFALSWLYARLGFDASPERSLAFLQHGFGSSQSPTLLPMLLWREWLWPFLPLSLLLLFPLGRRDLRAPTLAMLLALLPYWVLALLLLGNEDERGAYFLPLALPAAGLIAQYFRLRGTLVWILLSAGFGVLAIRTHESRKDHSSFAAAVERELGSEDGLVFVADGAEWSSMLIHQWDRDFIQLLLQVKGIPFEWPHAPNLRGAIEEGLRPMALRFVEDLVARRRRGQRLLLSAGALKLLNQPVLRHCILEAIYQRFELRRNTGAGGPLFELVPAGR